MSEPWLVKPAIVPGDAAELSPGLWQWDVSAQARVLAVGLQADPSKGTVAYVEALRANLPPYEWAREYLLDFSSHGGKPVFPEYEDRRHAATAPLSYVPNRPLIRGWDIPGPVGIVWLQRVPVKARGQTGLVDGPVRCHVLAELLLEGSVEEAGRQALALTREQFPDATEVTDWADPAAFDPRANDVASCADVLRRTCGIHLAPGPRTITDRLEPVRRWLLKSVPGIPPGEPLGAFLVDPSCVRIKEGFKGGYCYRELTGSPGRYLDVPDKRAPHSHLMDALAYALARMDAPTGEATPDMDTSRPLQFRDGLGLFRGSGFPDGSRWRG
jgi:hypothetical protein